MIKVTLEDGSVRDLPDGSLVKEALDTESARRALAGKVNGAVLDLDRPLPGDATVAPVTAEDEEGLEVLRHSTSHLMAAAVKDLYPETRVSIGPAIDTGFYYDFDRPTPFAPEDLRRIEARMEELARADHPFVRREMPRQEAMEFFRRMGEDYKVEILSELSAPVVSLYQTGPFIDLCTGPHVPSSGRLKVFRLLSIAGAYWRGDEKRQQLQRIYGTAFPTREALKEHLRLLEEAARRDHRRLGRELDLFSIQEQAGQGLIFWHPRGAVVRRTVEEFLNRTLLERGYQNVYTPHIARVDLWKTSGHWDFFRDRMYSPMDIEGRDYILKPMNCPGHILIFKSRKHSYRDLPVRLAEFGTVYRYEQSGELQGMLRVRGFTQDDSHIFCTPEQLEDEIRGCVDLSEYALQAFGFTQYEVSVSTGPDPSSATPEDWREFAGSPEDWARAEETLHRVMASKGWKAHTKAREAAFYGPKIDIDLKDCLGRRWQCSTIQLDFNLPRRFQVTYVGADNAEHPAIMVHRALLGSFERFLGCLIEHYAGAFPLWLAPTQAVVVPIAERHHEYARRVAAALGAVGVRVRVDDRNEKMGYKIREAQVEKVPYMLVVGDREAEGQAVAVRSRAGGDEGGMSLSAFVDRIRSELGGGRE